MIFLCDQQGTNLSIKITSTSRSVAAGDRTQNLPLYAETSTTRPLQQSEVFHKQGIPLYRLINMIYMFLLYIL